MKEKDKEKEPPSRPQQKHQDHVGDLKNRIMQLQEHSTTSSLTKPQKAHVNVHHAGKDEDSHTTPTSAKTSKSEKQLEANYELIQSLASTLSNHLKRQEVVGERSRELTIRGLDEISRISGIGMKREAKQLKESLREAKILSSKKTPSGQTIESGGEPASSMEQHDQHNPKTVLSQKTSTTEENRPRLIQSPLKLHPGAHNFRSPNNIKPPAGIPRATVDTTANRPPLPEVWMSPKKEQITPKATVRPVLKVNTDFARRTPVNTPVEVKSINQLPLPFLPNMSIGSSRNTSQYVTYRAAAIESLYSKDEPGLKIWQGKDAQSYFDIYRPYMMVYPDMDFPSSGSPVFRIHSAVNHREITTIWRNLSIRNSEEIHHWYKVYKEVLEATVNFLQRLCSRSKENAGLWETGQMWHDVFFPRRYFIEHMKQCYREEFGEPYYLTTDAFLIQFVNTLDTMCSMSTQEVGGNFARILDQTESEGCQASIGSGSTPETLHIRRYTAQIIVPYNCTAAEIGRPYELTPSLWDPHHNYTEIEAMTSYILDPPVPWLQWDSGKKAFVGTVPQVMQAFGQTNLDMYVDVQNNAPYCLDISIQACNFLLLPQAVQYERTIKGHMRLYITTPQEEKLPTIQTPLRTSAESELVPDANEEAPVQMESAHIEKENKEKSVDPDEDCDTDNCSLENHCGSENADIADIADIIQPEEEMVTFTIDCQKPMDLKYDPIVDGPPENFSIVGGLESPWGIEQCEVVPTYTSWARQRSYIEECVSSRGRKMMGLFARNAGDASESSETELSDEEGKYLQHIPYLTSMRKTVRPKMSTPVDEDEPPNPNFGSRRNRDQRSLPHSPHPHPNTPVLGVVKQDFNVMNGTGRMGKGALASIGLAPTNFDPGKTAVESLKQTTITVSGKTQTQEMAGSLSVSKKFQLPPVRPFVLVTTPGAGTGAIGLRNSPVREQASNSNVYPPLPPSPLPQSPVRSMENCGGKPKEDKASSSLVSPSDEMSKPAIELANSKAPHRTGSPQKQSGEMAAVDMATGSKSVGGVLWSRERIQNHPSLSPPRKASFHILIESPGVASWPKSCAEEALLFQNMGGGYDLSIDESCEVSDVEEEQEGGDIEVKGDDEDGDEEEVGNGDSEDQGEEADDEGDEEDEEEEGEEEEEFEVSDGEIIIGWANGGPREERTEPWSPID
ncbi:hypothetical protein DFH27DRAFT_559877 [Peziza echinospora]|nr:hypothetical protein DFH27DRAFT_559877 [Peziza echinospora]